MSYTNYKEISDFYNRVRELLGISNLALSDSSIDLEERAPKAERIIKNRVEDWQTLEDDKLLDFKSAVVIETAILCYNIASKRSIKSQQQPALKIEFRDSLDSEFQNLVNMLDDTILDISGYSSSGSVFVVT